MALPELRNVTRCYGDLVAVDNVSLTIEAGEWRQHIASISYCRK